MTSSGGFDVSQMFNHPNTAPTSSAHFQPRVFRVPSPRIVLLFFFPQLINHLQHLSGGLRRATCLPSFTSASFLRLCLQLPHPVESFQAFRTADAFDDSAAFVHFTAVPGSHLREPLFASRFVSGVISRHGGRSPSVTDGFVWRFD